MNNYGYMPYSPYGTGYDMTSQGRMGNIGNTMINPMNPARASNLKGRTVSSIDEVRGVPIEFDGNINYFPCPAQKAIFTKQIDPNSGVAVIREYKLQLEQTPTVQYADMRTVQMLAQKIEQIELYLQGGMTNVQSDTNITNDAAKSKSNSDISANGRK